jgi:four helix bundle protein
MDAIKTNDDLKARAKRFSVEFFRFYDLLPKTEQARIIGNQLIRSASSVGSNTRAVFRGRSTKEFVAKLGIVVEEADESCFWLEMVGELELVKNKEKVSALLKNQMN